MGGYVTSRYGSLLVAENSVDEQAVSRALKDLDRDLILTQEVDRRYRRMVWRVVKWMGGDRPVEHVCFWRTDDGEPLPLSFRLVDKVRSLGRGRDPLSVGQHGELSPALSEDEHNRRLEEEREREAAYQERELTEDMLPRIAGKRIPCLHRGQHLNRSRHKPGGRWYP